MPEISKISSVAIASIGKIFGIAKSSVGKFMGISAPAAEWSNTKSFHAALEGNNTQIAYSMMDPQFADTDFTNGTAGSFTHSCWINGGLSRYRDAWVSRSYWDKCQIEVRSTYVRVVHKTKNTGWQSGYAYTDMEADTWYHIAFSINTDTGVMKIYINGEHLGTKTHSDIETSLWSRTAGGWNIVYYPDYIDEVSIYDGVLSDAEVAELYGDGEAADLSTLDTYSDCVEWWRFDNDSYNGVYPDTITGEKGHDTIISTNETNADLLTTNVPT